MLTIRPFEPTEADYQAMEALDRAMFPQYPRAAEEWRYYDQARNPKYFYHRDMIEFDGDVIAFGSYSQMPWSYHPQKYHFQITAYPDHRHLQKARDEYFDHVMAVLEEFNPIAVTSGMFEDRTEHLSFLAQRGFIEIMRAPISQLEVADFDPTLYTDLLERVRDSGVKIVTTAELAKRDSSWKHRLYELDWELEQDVPSPEPPEKPSVEDFEKFVFKNPNYIADAFFVALENGDMMGETSLWVSQADKDRLITGLTGVVRSHRRRGIATALKVHAIEYARKQGIKIIETDNEENNPMYQINLMLGFEPKPAWIIFEKTLRSDSDESVE
jgi:GNAT superfamily N-acetyltransferase